MENNNNLITPLEIYSHCLTTINSIKFSKREIDVLSCILSGRSAKGIAHFLSISPKTAEAHTYNIMKKLECPSRESAISLIERSDKFVILKKYYSRLLMQIEFEKSLKKISTLIHNDKKTCLIIYSKAQETISFLLQKIKIHLILAGIKASVEVRENFESSLNDSRVRDYMIYTLPMELKGLASNFSEKMPTDTDQTPPNTLFLFVEKSELKEVPNDLCGAECIDFTDPENYYFSVFELLKKLLPHRNFQNIIEEFKQQYGLTNESSKVESSQEVLNVQKELPYLPTKESFLKKRKWGFLIGLIVAVSLLILGLFIIRGAIENEFWAFHSTEKKSRIPIRSDLILPNETTLLNLPELLDQIDNKFKGQSGIQSVALVGIGGSGKTTLARQYARQQTRNIVWEINAETNFTLMESFAKLAHALSKTDQDQKTLREVQETKNFSKREEKLTNFVKEHLKLQQPWFLIYDNVENFTDIQKYFPQDTNTWGEGKIILTTRNTNIQNNNQIAGIVLIEELTPNQKLSLFVKIMNHGENRKLTITQQKEIVEFLKELPPFPLDISVAAYYLKTMNVPYTKYLEYLNHQDKSFSTIQENLLKEAGAYEKTRYSIITLSLEKLIAIDKNFSDLLLFLSIIDSQNIPRDLLDIYKGKAVVDNFIYYLKKYSLIVNPLSDSASLLSHISIHRSAQDIIFAYLTEFLKLNKDSQSLKAITYGIDDYVDQVVEQEDFSKMRLMAHHLEKILNHPDLLSDFSKGILESKLGSIYYFINDDKSKKMLGNSLNILEKKNLEKLASADSVRLARSFLHIGTVYTELRLDKEAEEILKKAVHLYRNEVPKNYATSLSWALAHLGNLQRRRGHYEKAKDSLEESVRLHKQYGNDKQRIAHTLAYLGATYKGLGAYEKAIDNLKESLALYKENSSNDHVKVGWPLIQLGNVYRKLGEPEKAKGYFERGFLIYKKHLPENHMNMGLALACLGNCYRDLGDYVQSHHYLEQSLKIHQNYFDKNHRRMGWILFYLASTYRDVGRHQDAQKLFDKALEIYMNHFGEENIDTADRLIHMAKMCLEKNRLDDAEDFIKRSLQIFQLHNHVEAYRSLEVLGDIYLKKSFQLPYAKDKVESQNLKNQALDKFHQALKIMEEDFPDSSTHVQRIKNKIKAVE